MTSDSALSKFSELSPEQRQLLFEKIRQKKLAEARRLNLSGNKEDVDIFKASPHQRTLFSQLPSPHIRNRLLQIDLTASVSLSQLSETLNQLIKTHPILDSRLNSNALGFLQAEPGPLAATSQLCAQENDDSHWQNLLEELANTHSSDRCFHAHLVEKDGSKQTLFLITHPLLLDAYSILRIANQLLSLLNNSQDPQNSPKETSHQQFHFATWSQQMLDKKFLRNEWNRVTPKQTPGASVKLHQNELNNVSHWLSNDFIQEFAPAGTSTKQWLLEALEQCLSEFFSFNHYSYWFSDPQLKDSEFENLAGFFPYYVPVERANESKAINNPAQRYSQLHTRYSSVSEQLANHICLGSASSAPLVHYHWLDVEHGDNSSLQIESVRHHNSSLILSNAEIHITELVNGVTIDIHYARECFEKKQVEYLLSQFMSKLKQQSTESGSQKPSLNQQLENLWKELLQIETLNPNQNFFELGGHSLQVTEMKFRIKQLLKIDIPISVLYELPTIEKLSNYIVATHSHQLVEGLVEFESEFEEEGTL